MDYSLSINLFLLLFGGLQGLLLAFFLLRKRPDAARLFFALFILLATTQIFHKAISKVWLMDQLPGLYKVGYELPFLFGPLLYLYIRAACSADFKLSWEMGFHAIPFLFFGSARLLLMYVFPNSDLLYSLMPVSTAKAIAHAGLQLLSLWGYGLMARKLLSKAQNRDLPNYNWLRQFIGSVLILETLIIIALKLMTIYYGRFPDLRWIFFSLTVLVYWASYKVMEGRVNIVNLEDPKTIKKYGKSGLNAAQAKRIITQLQHLMATEQPFLDPEFKIEELAKQLDISRHHLSQAINSELKISFHDLINQYRTEQAKQWLSNPEKQHLTVAAIAYDSGFRSLSHFNAVFKTRAQQTPSAFRNAMLKKQ